MPKPMYSCQAIEVPTNCHALQKTVTTASELRIHLIESPRKQEHEGDNIKHSLIKKYLFIFILVFVFPHGKTVLLVVLFLE